MCVTQCSRGFFVGSTRLLIRARRKGSQRVCWNGRAAFEMGLSCSFRSAPPTLDSMLHRPLSCSIHGELFSPTRWPVEYGQQRQQRREERFRAFNISKE